MREDVLRRIVFIEEQITRAKVRAKDNEQKIVDDLNLVMILSESLVELNRKLKYGI